MARIAPALAIGVLAGASVAGCGGSGGGSKSGSGASKAETVKRANAVCKRHKSQISAAASKLLAGGKLPNPRQFGKLAHQTIIPQTQAQVGELAALEPPAEMSGAYAKWLGDQRALVAKSMQNPAAITNPKTFATVNAEARQLGLSDACQGGPS